MNTYFLITVPTILLAVTIYALFNYRKLSKALRIFSWFILFSTIIEFASQILWFNKINNMPLLHLFVAGGFLILANFYKEVLKDFVASKLIWTTTSLFLVFTIFNTLFFQSVFTFNSNALFVESILIVALSGYATLMSGSSTENVSNWINSGLLIHYSVNLPLLYFSDALSKLLPMGSTWVIHASTSILMYCFFFVGFRQRIKNYAL